MRLAAGGGTIRATGPAAAVATWRPALAAQKPGVLDVLRRELTEQPGTDLSVEDEAAIRDWLARIEEDDEEIIAETIERCRTSAAARLFFLSVAAGQRV
ncbi:MAG: hypothetical protein K8I04_06875 [Gammaproteobacteria bacterium]|nr:hypothetical protein [Gammaproteobacteria bacterium]